MMENPVLKINALGQVAYVVYDLDKTIEKMWKVFGIGPWKVNQRDCDATDDPSKITEIFYHHNPSRFAYKNASAIVGPNNLNFEIIQPISGESVFADILNRQGEGMHHFGWHLAQSQEEFEGVIKTLEQSGFPCLQRFQLHWVSVAYFDTTRVLNTLLEMSFRHPGLTKPDPLYVYPKSL